MLNIRRLKYLLVRPCNLYPSLFAIFFILQVCVNTVRYISTFNINLWLIEILFSWSIAFVISWVMTLILCLLQHKKILKCIWISICFLLTITNFLFDYSLYYFYEAWLDNMLVAIILGSNPSEGSEFLLSNLANGNNTINLILYVFFIIIFYVGSKPIKKIIQRKCKAQIIKNILLCMIGGSIIITLIALIKFNKNTSVSQSMVGKIIEFTHYKPAPDLNPRIPAITNSSDKPSNVVLVIGESHSSLHSSLNGYNKPTQPKLTQLQSDSSLFVFNRSVSPAITTVESFKRFFTTWNDEPEVNWYEEFNIIEAAKLAGYKTIWISNQAPKGFSDNTIFKIAKTCDYFKFTNDGNLGAESVGYDEDIFPILNNFNTDSCNNFFIIHLMGSHFTYNKRYPTNFNIFTAEDFTELPVNQRTTISEYDNSILYNDYIVNEIIQRFASEDALVLYLSDHGEDLYISDPEYCAHGKPGNKISAEAAAQIPIYIYIRDLQA